MTYQPRQANLRRRPLRALWLRLLPTAAMLALPAVVWGWAPLRGDDGQALSWPETAWPLALRPTSLADHRAAAAWTQAGPARWAPEGPWAGAVIPLPDSAETPVPDALADLAVDGVTAVVAVGSAQDWAELVGDPSLVGFALVTRQGEALVDVDVVLNTARFVVESAPDPAHYLRRTVVQHELGHALGLGHTCGGAEGPRCDSVSPEGLGAAMYPRIGPGDARAPNADDSAGLAAVVLAAPSFSAPLAVASVTPGLAAAEYRLAGLEPGERLAVWGAGIDARLLAHTANFAADSELGPELRVQSSSAVAAFSRWSADGRGGQVTVPAPRSDAGADSDSGTADAQFPSDLGPSATADGGQGRDFAADQGGGCAQSGMSAGAHSTALPFCLTLLCLPLALRRARPGDFGT